MIRTIICRFDTKKALDEFNAKLGLNLSPMTKDYDFSTFEEKQRQKPPKVFEYSQDYLDKLKIWQHNSMPYYNSFDEEIYATVNFHFDTEKYSSDDLAFLFDQPISDKTKSIRMPRLIHGRTSSWRVVGGKYELRYPIYVVSKNRSDKCYTSRFLAQMEVPHFVIVEQSQYEDYKKHVDPIYCRLLILDQKYQEDYDTFDDLGDTKSKGPGAARNFAWDHSIKHGYKYHWVFDDNTTEGFHYFFNNRKIKCRTGAFFNAYEDFVDRYENIAIAGLNYTMFLKSNECRACYTLNTRIYSFLLIRNDIPYRWRGRYNEDTDLSLRALKDGWCTIQFNCFTAGKATTQKVQGGNTEEFYKHEGTLEKSKMLEQMHPDVAKVVYKFSRWHHHVDYSQFNQQLKLKPEYENTNFGEPINMYGMRVIVTNEDRTDDTRSYIEQTYKDQPSLSLDTIG